MSKKDNDTRSPDEVINQDEFRIPASDSKGHNTRIYFRARPALADQADVVFNSRQFPYKTKGDLFRHALVRHLKWLEEQGDFPSRMRQIEAQDIVLREIEYQKEFKDTFNQLQSQVAAFLADGNIALAQSLVSRVRGQFLSMEDGEWKDKYMKELDTKCGHMLVGRPVVLTDFSGGSEGDE